MTPGVRSPRRQGQALAQGLLVTFLWSTSWVLIKVGLDDLDLAPISFAGLRYALAAAILLPFGLRAVRAAQRTERIGSGLLARTAVYGLLLVAVAQGAQFAALAVLPATTVSLVLASTPAVVALMALGGTLERASRWQAAGIGLLTIGAVLYLGRFDVPAGAAPGFLAAGICVVAAAAASHVGRGLARDATTRFGGPIGLTASSMAVGAIALLAVGVVLEGVPALPPLGWLIVGWLAVVNTAFAFTLWNHTLRTLTAVESSVVNNTMTIQIAILAIVVLGERLAPLQLVGLVLVAAGAALVQLAPVWAARRVRLADVRVDPGGSASSQ